MLLKSIHSSMCVSPFLCQCLATPRNYSDVSRNPYNLGRDNFQVRQPLATRILMDESHRLESSESLTSKFETLWDLVSEALHSRNCRIDSLALRESKCPRGYHSNATVHSNSACIFDDRNSRKFELTMIAERLQSH